MDKKIKFLADENLEKPIVDYLRGKGYEVLYIAEISPSMKDEEIMQLANKDERILITNDRDFGELTFHKRKVTSGIILIRAMDEKSQNKVELIKHVLIETKGKLRGKFIVVNEAGIRIKKIL